MKKITETIKLKSNKKLHSKEHLLADDLCGAMMEPERFAAYLGIAKLYDEDGLRTLAKRVVGKKDLTVESRGKYFFSSLKTLRKKT